MKVALVRLLLNLGARLPLPASHWLGGGLGRLLLLSDNEQLRVARINLARCFPELGPAEQHRLLSQTLMETGKTFFESGKLWLGNGNDVLGLVREIHGEEHLQEGLERGKGVILAIPHLGNWEVIGLYCSSRHPMTSLYRPPRMTGLDRMIRRARERFGAKLVPTTAKGVRALYQALADNEVVAILPDQDPREGGGCFAPFFGIQANTMTLLSRLVSKSNATVLCCYAERLPKGRGFAIHFEPAPAELYANDVETSVTALNGMVEQAVRRLPTQYQWGYRRFLTRPEGEPDFYDHA
jgi:KDO2-lipid IV(A) lauroyltransferase